MTSKVKPNYETDERGQYQWHYGHFGGGDPRDFVPDMEMCMPEEIARWKADLERAEHGENVTAPPAGTFVYSDDGILRLHILHPAYGVGMYKYRIEDANHGHENES